MATATATASLNFYVVNNLLTKTGDRFAANPDYAWDDIGVIPKTAQQELMNSLRDAPIIDDEDEIPGLKFNEEFLTGRRGLLTRVKNYDDVPKKLIERIAERIDTKKLSSSIIGDFVIMCLSNNNNKAVKKVIDACSENKKEMIIGYVDDNDVSAYQKLVKLLKL